MASSNENRLLFILDEVDKRVQEFRQAAISLEEEKQELVKALDTLSQSSNLTGLTQCEQEEISAHVNRLVYRCLTVEISIETPRNEAQQQAYTQAVSHMNAVKKILEKNVEEGKHLVEVLLNACSSDDKQTGAVDSKFQSYLLGCTLEDQKKIKKKLQNWTENLQKNDFK